MEIKEVWKNAISYLETDLSRGVINTFFANTKLTSLENGKAQILCPSKISADYLRRRYSSQISQALKELTEGDWEIEFQISQRVAPVHEAELGPLFSPPTLDGLVSRYTFENFVVGIPNQLAAQVASALVANPGSLPNPLFIHSGVGLGKTHLMHAIGNAIKEQGPKAKILYVGAEQFTNEFIKSVQNSRSAAIFRKKFRAVDLLLVDDVQFFAKREGTQEEFFNTFNELYLAGKQVVLTSDQHPEEIKKLDSRLVSRFCGGVVADIQEPDVDMRLEILKKKVKEQEVRVAEEALLALAQDISGSIRRLEGALNQLLAVATTQRITPTRELAQAVLKSRPQPQKFLEPADVVATTSLRYGVSVEEIKSAKRSKELVLPRQVAAYLLRNLAQLSLSQIGDLLGGRDHTTILHAVQKIEKAQKENSVLQDQIRTLRGEILGKTA
ncbi:MAG: chromosomal replication initiator protein DnaA [Patescibacteria group bacterium]